jgi:hypothetical protein
MYRELSKKGLNAIGSTMTRDPQARFDAAYQLLAHVSQMLEFRRASQQR